MLECCIINWLLWFSDPKNSPFISMYIIWCLTFPSNEGSCVMLNYINFLLGYIDSYLGHYIDENNLRNRQIFESIYHLSITNDITTRQVISLFSYDNLNVPYRGYSRISLLIRAYYKIHHLFMNIFSCVLVILIHYTNQWCKHRTKSV